MHHECFRSGVLVAVAICAGWIGWSGHVLLLPVAAAFPLLWSLARFRLQAAAVSAAYFLTASRGLPQGIANFYSSDIWFGLLLWLVASSAFVTVHSLLWTDRGGWRKPLRYMTACVVMAVPPFGILGWAHPVTAAGILFPGWGWWGLTAMAVVLAVMMTRYRSAAAIIMSGFWLWSAVAWTTPNLPASWIGIDLEMGASLGRNASLPRQRELIEIARRHLSGSTVVLPESALGFWTPSVSGIWQRALTNTGTTVLAGAAIIDEKGYDNVLVKIFAGGNDIVYRERMSVPGSMWQPWRNWIGNSGSARAHVFANPVVIVADMKIAPLICYEQLLVWPVLQSMSRRPDAIVAVGNGWWAAARPSSTFSGQAVTLGLAYSIFPSSSHSTLEARSRMLDAALIKQCADPSLKPAVVEQFVQSVGSDDPLAITVKSGGRFILVPKSKTPEEAIEIVRGSIKGSVVRVGISQIPAGIGLKDVSKLKSDLFEPCANLKLGTAMFAKVLRIVAKWYGNPTNEEVFPQLFDDAIYSWKTGKFEGDNVFLAEDPRGTVVERLSVEADNAGDGGDGGSSETPKQAPIKPNDAGIRVDLSRIGGET